MPTISVIVPVYNVEKYIHRCVDSILAQTYTDFELILIDDGSLDRCGYICDSYAKGDTRVKVFHQENQGQAVARNVGLDWVINISDSQYVSFVDSDDWVHPRYLELLYKAIIACDARISQCLYIETRNKTGFREVEENICRISVEEQYINWYNGMIWSKLFHKNCFTTVRFPNGKIYEDVAIWYKLLFAEEQVALIKEVLYFYFINSQSTSRRGWTSSSFERVRAWDQQLAFHLGRNNKTVLRVAGQNYCNVAEQQYREILKSNEINVFSRLYYLFILKARVLISTCKVDRALGEKGIYLERLKFFFPRINWLYWEMLGIKEKLKRILHINVCKK